MLMQDHAAARHPAAQTYRAATEIRPAKDCARFSLRIAPEHLSRAAEAFGSALPEAIGDVAVAGERLALCLGPDEWQLYAPLDEQDGIEARFAALYPDCLHSLVDIGHREVGFDIEGPAAALLLRSGCPRDLEHMPPGTGTRTIFDKAQIVLIRHDAERFRLEVWPSFAPYVQELLSTARREIALGL